MRSEWKHERRIHCLYDNLTEKKRRRERAGGRTVSVLNEWGWRLRGHVVSRQREEAVRADSAVPDCCIVVTCNWKNEFQAQSEKCLGSKFIAYVRPPWLGRHQFTRKGFICRVYETQSADMLGSTWTRVLCVMAGRKSVLLPVWVLLKCRKIGSIQLDNSNPPTRGRHQVWKPLHWYLNGVYLLFHNGANRNCYKA